MTATAPAGSSGAPIMLAKPGASENGDTQATGALHESAATGTPLGSSSVASPSASGGAGFGAGNAKGLVGVIFAALMMMAETAIEMRTGEREDIRNEGERIAQAFEEKADTIMEFADKKLVMDISAAVLEGVAQGFTAAASAAGPAAPAASAAFAVAAGLAKAGAGIVAAFAEHTAAQGRAAEARIDAKQERARTSKELSQGFLQEWDQLFTKIIDVMTESSRSLTQAHVI